MRNVSSIESHIICSIKLINLMSEAKFVQEEVSLRSLISFYIFYIEFIT